MNVPQPAPLEYTPPNYAIFNVIVCLCVIRRIGCVVSSDRKPQARSWQRRTHLLTIRFSLDRSMDMWRRLAQRAGERYYTTNM